MKLEVGMYVRTKDRGIAKFYGWSAYDENKVAIHTHNEGDIAITPVIDKNVIIKASFNIIDLVEVGDVLVDATNEKLEVLLIDNELMVRNMGLIYDYNYYLPIKNIKLKSIVTHEQMEEMSYKLEEQ